MITRPAFFIAFQNCYHSDTEQIRFSRKLNDLTLKKFRHDAKSDDDLMDPDFPAPCHPNLTYVGHVNEIETNFKHPTTIAPCIVKCSYPQTRNHI